MWRDQIDAFWDGQRTFVIGFFKTAEAARVAGPKPDLAIISAKNADFTERATLLDVVDAPRWRCGHCVLSLPQDHSFVSLHSPDGAELHYWLTDEDFTVSGGEWRLALTELPDGSAGALTPYRIVSSSVRGGLERLTRDQIGRRGPKLVWAVCQGRHVARRDGAVTIAQLWPAQRVFPEHQSRIEIEALETLVERGSSVMRAPFAIMENWLRENGAPCAALRIEIPKTRDRGEAILGRTNAVIVMHQRRRFREWVRQQKAVGSPIADDLDFDAIRQATGFPHETPEAVESGGAIVVHNLLSMATSPETTDFDGVALRRISNGAGAEAAIAFDVHFFGATLGDDIGLVSTTADAGDFGVTPSDPGGSPYVRLLRLEGDGLQPRKVDDDDALLDEILRISAIKEKAPTTSRADSDGEDTEDIQERREKLLSALNSSLASCGYEGHFYGLKMWDIFEPALLTSFVSIVEDAAPEAREALLRMGGYKAYRNDPSLIQSLIRHPELADAIDEKGFRESQSGSQSLIGRFATACRVPGLAGANADIQAQIESCRAILQPGLAKRLITAQVSLAGVEEFRRKIDEVIAPLLEETNVERAIAYCDNLELDQEANALRDYILRRNAGLWTSLQDAERLSLLVQEANDYWRRIEEHYASGAAQAEQPPEPPKSPGLFAAMRNFFSRGSGRPRA